MAKYRPIDMRVWNDRKFLALSQDGRMLWLFFLTAPSTLPIPGVFVGGEAAIAEQLGWDVQRYRQSFAELLRQQLAIGFEGRLVWLKNALRYQPPKNPNMVRCWADSWDDVPECAMKTELWQALKIACDSWSQLFRKLFAEPLPQQTTNSYTQNQEQNQEQEQKQRKNSASPPGGGSRGLFGEVQEKQKGKKPKPSDPTEAELASVRVVLEKLSAQNGVRYSVTDEHTRLIVNQLRNGVSEMDLRAVIGYCAHELWQDKPEMVKYLRPETLFGPKTISKYLDPARTWFEKLNGEAPQESTWVPQAHRPFPESAKEIDHTEAAAAFRLALEGIDE